MMPHSTPEVRIHRSCNSTGKYTKIDLWMRKLYKPFLENVFDFFAEQEI
jgi:hypothetical protein